MKNRMTEEDIVSRKEAITSLMEHWGWKVFTEILQMISRYFRLQAHQMVDFIMWKWEILQNLKSDNL